MWTDYVLQDASGSRMNLGIFFPENNENQCTVSNGALGLPGPLNSSGNMVSSPVGSFLSATDPVWTSEGIVNAVDVVDGDGTLYSFGSLSAPSYGYINGNINRWGQTGGMAVPSSITDRNGNVARFTTSGIQGQPVLTYTDTIGRPALSISSFGGTPDNISVYGLSQPYQVQWTSIAGKFPITMNPVPDMSASNCGISNGGGSEGSSSAISSIMMPNGQQYGFSYDPTYGMVSQINYPSGGSVKYEWGLNSQSEYGDFITYSQYPVIGGGGMPTGQSYTAPSGSCTYYYDTPAIQHRYVYNNGQLVEQQDFSYTTTWNNPSGPAVSAATVLESESDNCRDS